VILRCAAVTIAAVASILAGVATAQPGVWRTHTDMQNVRDIAVHDGKVLAATSGGVFLSTTDGFIRYTNVDGLSDIDYTAAAFMPDGRIVAGASTGFVNIRGTDGVWLEISDIARSVQLPRRGVTAIVPHDGLLYFATEYGLSVYDPQRQEFGDSYMKFGHLPPRQRVNDVFFFGSEIWVASEGGVAYADLTTPNLQDPANWTSFSNITGVEGAQVHSVASFDNHVVVAADHELFSFDGVSWTRLASAFAAGDLRKLLPDGERLLILSQFGLYELRAPASITQIADRLNTGDYPAGLVFTDFAMDGNSIVTATTSGIAARGESDRWNFSFPDGPASNFFKALAVDGDGVLWAASGLSEKGIYSFDGQIWRNYDSRNQPEILSNAVTDVTSGPDGSVWFSTRGGGVVQRRADGVFLNYSPQNVPGFPGIENAPAFAAVEGIHSDARGNIWSLHLRSNGGLLGCRRPDDTWLFFSDPSMPVGRVVSGLTVDRQGRKWLMITDEMYRGLLVFDDKGTLEQSSDDTWTRFRANDANAVNAQNDVTSLAVDILGDIWIGTDRGLRTIFNPRINDRVSKTCFNVRCNIEGLYISSIAIDPVNNKWLGTKDGVFVLSPDGSEIIAQYNTANSDLLDDEIMSILVHPGNGIAYIATRRGLSSLETPYVEPLRTFESITIGPNPFRPGVDDRLLIDGLVENAIVKVLSVSGVVVAEFSSPGGRVAFWDGRTDDGAYAASGVYFIVAAAPNGKQSGVGKVAVIRQ
jgi:ligand-binding sensor domain-containing protein